MIKKHPKVQSVKTVVSIVSSNNTKKESKIIIKSYQPQNCLTLKDQKAKIKLKSTYPIDPKLTFTIKLSVIIAQRYPKETFQRCYQISGSKKTTNKFLISQLKMIFPEE